VEFLEVDDKGGENGDGDILEVVMPYWNREYGCEDPRLSRRNDLSDKNMGSCLSRKLKKKKLLEICGHYKMASNNGSNTIFLWLKHFCDNRVSKISSGIFSAELYFFLVER
jgi:hypothetical protein